MAGPSGTVVAVTFHPHPLRLLRPEAAPQTLQPPAEREHYLRLAGADEVRVMAVDRELLAMTALEFIDRLHQDLKFDCIVEGPDFQFGKGRQGDVEFLRRQGKHNHFTVQVVEPIQVQLCDGATAAASSSLLRWLVAHGRVEDMVRVMGRPMTLTGKVVRGDQRGREIGWPTANLDYGDRMVPADGVYAGRATLPDGTRRRAAISIGTKPTFGLAERTVEAFLIDHTSPVDHYGWTLSLTFDRWLREQSRFDAIDALVEQMHRDVGRTRLEVLEEVLAQ